MKDADKTRGARPSRLKPRGSKEEPNSTRISLCGGDVSPVGVVLLESKSGLRVEEAPGAGDVVSLSNGSE